MKFLKNENENNEIQIKESIPGISHRTIEKIKKAWEESGNAPPKIRMDIPKEDEGLLKQIMQDCILEKGGELTNKSRIVHLGMIYLHSTKEGKEKILNILASDFDVDIEKLNKSIKELKTIKDEKNLIKAELNLREALVPPVTKLLRQFITLPNGFIFLKDMRREILKLEKKFPRFKKLDIDIKNLLKGYFDINLLDLKEITWNSPAALLENLKEFEAVHEITSWKALKYRLHSDHRIFAFIHHRMPNEPLVFVEVALVNGIAGNINKLLNEDTQAIDPEKVDTAIFYSISSTQKGLRGINFGNFLIKQVVNKLSKELPNLKCFATLSPIPKFIDWLGENINTKGADFFTKEESKKIRRIALKRNTIVAFLRILNSEKWYENTKKVDAIRTPLMRLCTHYLINEKKGNKTYDPVANFHLRNGAKVQQLNWLGDISQKGIEQSAGIMVNYYYEVSKIVSNHESYISEAKVHASKAVRDLLKK
ncbi:MAG: malonyl-CoA decarboxylase family protein [Bacteroidota bacterium]|nr:malonyl-CoA decarboxylase family protein [Bacteroidota bacterium]